MEILIIALPLIASIISGFFGKFIGDRNSEIVTSLLVTISAILSMIILYQVIFNQYQSSILTPLLDWTSRTSTPSDLSLEICFI